VGSASAHVVEPVGLYAYWSYKDEELSKGEIEIGRRSPAPVTGDVLRTWVI